MLTLNINAEEEYDDAAGEFVYYPAMVVEMENSLVAISEWESKHKIHYLNNKNLTDEQATDFIRCMIINKNIRDEAMKRIVKNIDLLKEIKAYMEDPHTATTISNNKIRKGAPHKSREIITAEVVYFWMTQLSIPFECDTWNINNLLALIGVCNIKGSTNPEKMSKKDILAQNAALNKARRMKNGSKG